MERLLRSVELPLPPRIVLVGAFCFHRWGRAWRWPIVHRGKDSTTAIVSEPGHSWKVKVDSPQKKKMSECPSCLERVNRKRYAARHEIGSLALPSHTKDEVAGANETNEGMATQQ